METTFTFWLFLDILLFYLSWLIGVCSTSQCFLFRIWTCCLGHGFNFPNPWLSSKKNDSTVQQDDSSERNKVPGQTGVQWEPRFDIKIMRSVIWTDELWFLPTVSMFFKSTSLLHFHYARVNNNLVTMITTVLPKRRPELSPPLPSLPLNWSGNWVQLSNHIFLSLCLLV